MVSAQAEGVAWDFLATLRQKFDAHLDVIRAQQGGTDQDCLMAFLEDVNDILILVGQLENRMMRLERRLAR